MFKKHYKKLLCFALSVIMIAETSQTAFAAETVSDSSFQDGYDQICTLADEYGVPFTMTFEEYVSAFEESGFDTAEEYADAYLGLFEPTSSISANSSSSSSSKWYYDIGTSLPSDANPTYDTYNLYDTVQKGDIIFEAKGGFGITGHIAIVEGKYYDAAKGVNYIRIIEAIDVGVVRSCLDDTRVDDKNVVLLRVSRATDDDIDAAVDFCIGELDSSYFLDFQKDTSADETDWYCSELVWAAYYNQGINIEVSGYGEPGITPRDIRNSAETETIDFK